MKAKPTQYGAIRTRSRLEAKWCVFFDVLGVPWQYEPACPIPGYLPDFIVETATDTVWVEIKPESWFEHPDMDRLEDEARWQVLADTTDQCVIVYFGPPGTWEGGVLRPEVLAIEYEPRGPAVGLDMLPIKVSIAQAVRDHDYASGERWGAA